MIRGILPAAESPDQARDSLRTHVWDHRHRQPAIDPAGAGSERSARRARRRTAAATELGDRRRSRRASSWSTPCSTGCRACRRSSAGRELVVGDRGSPRRVGRSSRSSEERRTRRGWQEAPSDELELANAALIRLQDALWAVRKDRLRTAREVEALADGETGIGSLRGYTSIQQALSAIDRLEVRGRDSAGIHLFVWDHGIDLDDPGIAAAIADPQRRSAVRFGLGARCRRSAQLRLQGGSGDR